MTSAVRAQKVPSLAAGKRSDRRTSATAWRPSVSHLASAAFPSVSPQTACPMTGTMTCASGSSTSASATGAARVSPARIAAQDVAASCPSAVTIPNASTRRFIAWTRWRGLPVLAADRAGPLLGHPDRDDRPLQHGERRRVLVVVQHRVERARDTLAFELDVERHVDELGLALDLVGGDTAARRACLVASTHREVRVLDAGGIAVALDGA